MQEISWLKMILENTRLKKKIKEVLTKNPFIVDVVVFGSSVRGKRKPKDIDLLVVFKDRVIKSVEHDIKKIVETDYKEISIISKTEETLLDNSFDARESFLFEGISLITGDTLGQRYGFFSFGIFRYDFKDWSKLKKTKFYYALNGRGSSEGMFHELDCIKLADNILMVPLIKIELMRDFLDSWNLDYIYIPTLIPERLAKKSIIG